ncbi:hypothetical protein SRHO_G00177900 [Serrasalmus rhombeus]
MASSLEDDLSCSVCCEVYQEPQLLPCGHSFCCRCLEKHWAVNSARTCAVCRQKSPQKPVANLVLRNACESFLKEKERKSDGEVRCSQHGEKLQLFCKTDEQAICLECRKHSHSSHRVQPLAHAVRQRKSQVKVVLRPAEKALKALRNGTTQNSQITKYIESQVQQAEKMIKKEFERFHQFLHEDEEARITLLKKEAKRKRDKVQERIERELLSLSERVKEVEEEMENDGATFLQNFDSVLQRAEYTEPDSKFGSEILINMPEHVGNLGYRVWKKMKDIFRYYPVVLDPNTAPADFSISDDLICVRKTSRDRPIPVPHRGNRIVLGSEGYTDGTHCWDIEVGGSKHWTIGVCQRSYHLVHPLSPENGFWSLTCHNGDFYKLLSSKSNCFRLKKKLRMVRVQLAWQYCLDCLKKNIWSRSRTLGFLDADDGSMIAFTVVPSEVALFPFLIPDERFAPLRIAPADVPLTVEQILPFEEKKTKGTVYTILLVIVSFIFGMLMRNE